MLHVFIVFETGQPVREGLGHSLSKSDFVVPGDFPHFVEHNAVYSPDGHTLDFHYSVPPGGCLTVFTWQPSGSRMNCQSAAKHVRHRSPRCASYWTKSINTYEPVCWYDGPDHSPTTIQTPSPPASAGGDPTECAENLAATVNTGGEGLWARVNRGPHLISYELVERR